MAWVRKTWARPRFRIVFWAAFAALFLGASSLSMPLEDMLRVPRVKLRQHPSNGKIVVVLQDSRTLDAIQAIDVTRAHDAQVIEHLFRAGAKRVFFDRVLTTYGSERDTQYLLAVLKKYPKRVFLGAMPGNDGQGGNYAGNLPDRNLLVNAHPISLLALHHPFNLGLELPYASDSPVGRIPSLAAQIADISGDTSTLFSPDFSIDVNTIPSLSYIDIMNGSFDASSVAGKDIVIAPGAVVYNDIHTIPGQGGSKPGGFIQAMAGETLTRGIPSNYGWFPALVLTIVIVASGFGRGNVFDWKRATALVVVIVAAPFVLDYFRIRVDVAPALLFSVIAVIRMRNLENVEVASETNAGSGLPSVQALRNSDVESSRILVALKIRNYSAIIGSFAEHVEAQVAAEIVRRIRISDEKVTVYHEGGMFLWFSSIRSTFDVIENLEGLHRIVQNGIQVGGLDIDLSFNCGIDSDFERPVSSRVAGAMQSAEEAVRNDELVYQHDSRRHEAQWEISLLTSLDRAIDNGEVWVAYQPKLDLHSDRISGAEALVRWTHPERGPISPEKFIRIAEEFHRIERITRFVIDDAVRSAVELSRLGYDMTMSVNISAQLLRNPGLPGMIGEVLAYHGLSPDRLVLEITETDRLDRSSRTFQMLQRLVQSGLRLSIDDFGTGNATIDYLRYLPASEVKIDKLFVQSMEENKDDMVLVQSIIDMAHSLDRVVVAEGVETATTLEILKKRGCDQIQGYYVSRPVPFRDFLEVIAAEGRRRTG